MGMTAERRTSACYGAALRKASRRVAQLYDNAVAPCGLKATQYGILAELSATAENPPSLAELADQLVLDRSALGHNLRPLERDGFVAIRKDKEDRRVRKIVLTAKGRTKFDEARKLWRTAQERFLSVYGEDEAAALRGSLLAIAYDERLGSLSD
jgi:DNA-binding MarR family transcriptional regulator